MGKLRPYLGDKPFYKKLITIALPITLQNLNLSICIPVLISDTLLGLGNSAVGVVMGHIGETFVAANVITTVTVQLSTVFIQGMSNASAIITGHSLGEGLDLLCPKTGSDH